VQYSVVVIFYTIIVSIFKRFFPLPFVPVFSVFPHPFIPSPARDIVDYPQVLRAGEGSLKERGRREDTKIPLNLPLLNGGAILVPLFPATPN
jgi:hypothetical protein